MRWMFALGLVSVGCAAGAEMRPRGKRNSVRIEALEKRIAALEAERGAPGGHPPTKPPPADDLDAKPDAKPDAKLDAKLDALQAKIDTLQAELAKRPAVAAQPPVRYGMLDPAKHHAVPLDDSPSIGPANAPVTMVAAVQFPEPYTHKVWPTLVALHGEYKKDLRIVFKSFVVHPRARDSSIAACAAGYQKRLDKMEGEIYAAANDGGPTRQLSEAELRELARGLRLDLKQYDHDVSICNAALVRDEAMFKALGQGAVPVFWINGRPLSGAQPIEAFRTVIDQERSAAAEDKAAGNKPADYYERVTGTKPAP